MTAENLEVPAWPRITAVVRADGTAEVVVDGAPQQVRAGDVDAARRAVLEHVRLHAADALARPVRVSATDPDGSWELLVHPDGTVAEAAPAAPGVGQPQHPAAVPPSMADLRAELGTPAGRGAQPAPALRLVREPAELPVAELPAAELPAAGLPVVEPAAAGTSAVELPAVEPPAAPPPTLDDLIAGRPAEGTAPATAGWRGAVRRLTGGLVAPAPGVQELRRRAAVQAVQRSFDGPRTVVVVNPKGGAHKTTATLLIAAAFGRHRGGSTLAWDNNETRGTLGWRARPARHTRTAVDLLRDLDALDAAGARLGDLDRYVRPQGPAHFDVLASDEDAASAAAVDAAAFDRLHAALTRSYRLLVVDTGNNMRAGNWQAAVRAADQLVIVSTVREDTAQSAAWLVDALRAAGSEDLVTHAVTVLSSPARTPDPALRARLHEHFGRLTRAVVDVPHDPALVPGGPVAHDALSAETGEAWLRVCATIANGL